MDKSDYFECVCEDCFSLKIDREWFCAQWKDVKFTLSLRGKRILSKRCFFSQLYNEPPVVHVNTKTECMTTATNQTTFIL